MVERRREREEGGGVVSPAWFAEGTEPGRAGPGGTGGSRLYFEGKRVSVLRTDRAGTAGLRRLRGGRGVGSGDCIAALQAAAEQDGGSFLFTFLLAARDNRGHALGCGRGCFGAPPIYLSSNSYLRGRA